MADETLLVALLGGLHLLGFAFAAILLLPCLRDESVAPLAGRREDEDDGGGGSDRLPQAAPRSPGPGGIPIPLPDAVPARVRLRDADRLADLLPGFERRPAHPPLPQRQPVRRAAAGAGTSWRTAR
jgi:hypothetical protein